MWFLIRDQISPAQLCIYLSIVIVIHLRVQFISHSMASLCCYVKHAKYGFYFGIEFQLHYFADNELIFIAIQLISLLSEIF